MKSIFGHCKQNFDQGQVHQQICSRASKHTPKKVSTKNKFTFLFSSKSKDIYGSLNLKNDLNISPFHVKKFGNLGMKKNFLAKIVFS